MTLNPQQTFALPSMTDHLPEVNLADFNLPQMAVTQNQDPERLFDFDIEGVNFNLDGFWEDFSLLGEGSGFPFK